MTRWLLLALMTCSFAFAEDTASQQAAKRGVEELSRSIRVPVERIQITDVQPMKWPDTGLGCPQRGATYEVRPTSGHRVLASVDGTVYRIHVDATRAVVCDRGLKPEQRGIEAVNESPTAQSGTEPTDEPSRKAIRTAKEDLAKRLNVTVDAIVFVSFQSVTWPDRSLGCPKPGMIYPQVQEDGARIRLRSGDQTYAYHLADSRGPFLCESGKKP